ncbi:hypothetical protein [Thermocatellispora tengchongensis]|uniref:hypothetical protein n=1 Tax=Thermocatellispora tengchongensis TaxID=1073253 RepID=UPI00362CD691
MRLPVNGLLPAGLTFYPADLRPVPALAVLVVALVPVASVLVTLSALRRVVVEPLGVVRLSADRRRKLWWRLILPVAGLALLYPLRSGLSGQAQGFEFQVMAGVAALLAGVALLLPWVVEAVVRRLGGGGVAWQLAVRRLQLDSGTAVRVVSGIAVSVAGLIALQGLLAAVQTQYAAENRRHTGRFQAMVFPTSRLGADWATELRRWETALNKAPGVRAADAVTSVAATPTGAARDESIRVLVGDCAVLRQRAQLGACADGDAFVVASPEAPPRPGTTYTLGDATETTAKPRPRWSLPASARTVQPHPGDPSRPIRPSWSRPRRWAAAGPPRPASRTTSPWTPPTPTPSTGSATPPPGWTRPLTSS